MKILDRIQKQTEKTVVALGYFDGVHLGHSAVLAKACETARQLNAVPAAFTFDMRAARAAAKGSGDLDTYEHRAAHLREIGIGLLVQVPFGEVSAMTPEEFARQVLGETGLNAAAVCCGADFRFGRERAGDVEMLKTLGEQIGFSVCVLPDVTVDGAPVSTTRIKALVQAGDVETAAKLLGRPYGFQLVVCEDKKLARTLGFPTMNQRFPTGVIAPKFGVYHVQVHLDGRSYDAVCNVGVRPSVQSDGSPVLETHILDFAGELYGQTVAVDLLRFLREERRFDSVDALREQVLEDIAHVRRLAGAK